MSSARHAIASTSKVLISSATSNVARPATPTLFCPACQIYDGRAARRVRINSIRHQSTTSSDALHEASDTLRDALMPVEGVESIAAATLDDAQTTPGPPRHNTQDGEADVNGQSQDALDRSSASSSSILNNASHKGKETARSSGDPSIQDLLTFEPDKISIPKPTDLSTTTEFALYTRRFNGLLKSIDRAFTKSQINKFASKLLTGVQPKWPKRQLVRRIMSEYWGLPDPEEHKAREKLIEEAQRSRMPDLEETVQIDEKQLFLLLGKMDGNEPIGRLRRECGVKLNVRGPPPALHVSGPVLNVSKFKKEWEKFLADIQTVEIDSGSSKGLRPDLYKTLSLASDTFVAPHPSVKSKVRVTYRSASYNPAGRVESMLRILASHDSIQASVPHYTLASSVAEREASLLPFVTREEPSWMLSSLPLFGLSRATVSQRTQDEVQSRYSADVSVIRKELLKGMDGEEDVKLVARFGHRLYIRPDAASRSVTLAPLPELFSAVSRERIKTTFLPSAPPGFLNPFGVKQTRSSIEDLRTQMAHLSTRTSSLRRLLYLSNAPTAPYEFLSFQRNLPVNKTLVKQEMKAQEEEPDVKRWTGTVGKESLLDISMPHISCDMRLCARTSHVAPEEVTAPIAPLFRQAAPTSLSHLGKTYYLYSDIFARRTVFTGGLSLQAPWVDLGRYEIALERRTDRAQKPKVEVTTGVEMECRSGLQDLEDLLERVKGMDGGHY